MLIALSEEDSIYINEVQKMWIHLMKVNQFMKSPSHQFDQNNLKIQLYWLLMDCNCFVLYAHDV